MANTPWRASPEEQLDQAQHYCNKFEESKLQGESRALSSQGYLIKAKAAVSNVLKTSDLPPKTKSRAESMMGTIESLYIKKK